MKKNRVAVEIGTRRIVSGLLSIVIMMLGLTIVIAQTSPSAAVKNIVLVHGLAGE